MQIIPPIPGFFHLVGNLQATVSPSNGVYQNGVLHQPLEIVIIQVKLEEPLEYFKTIYGLFNYFTVYFHPNYVKKTPKYLARRSH